MHADAFFQSTEMAVKDDLPFDQAVCKRLFSTEVQIGKDQSPTSCFDACISDVYSKAETVSVFDDLLATASQGKQQSRISSDAQMVELQ